MKIITAPETYDRFSHTNDIFCFLAGGITGYRNWQEEVIATLLEYDDNNHGELDRLIIFNPRREFFPSLYYTSIFCIRVSQLIRKFYYLINRKVRCKICYVYY